MGRYVGGIAVDIKVGRLVGVRIVGRGHAREGHSVTGDPGSHVGVPAKYLLFRFFIKMLSRENI